MRSFVADYTQPTTHLGPYGVIGAYDGWPIGIGRVAVDSTFHHFFDINLIGDMDCLSDDPRRHGYTRAASGKAALAQIDNYHRNLAFWLGHPRFVLSKFGTLLSKITADRRLIQTLEAGSHEPERHYRTLGGEVATALGQHGMPVAQAFDAFLMLIDHRVLAPWFWGNAGGRPVLSAREAAHVFSCALGGGLTTLHGAGTRHADDPEELLAILRDGVGRGTAVALREWPTTLRNPSAALRAALTPSAVEGVVAE